MEHVDVALPASRSQTERLRVYVGAQFVPHGTDSVGTVLYATDRLVEFSYAHDPEKRHSMERRDFTTRFAQAVSR